VTVTFGDDQERELRGNSQELRTQGFSLHISKGIVKEIKNRNKVNKGNKSSTKSITGLFKGMDGLRREGARKKRVQRNDEKSSQGSGWGGKKEHNLLVWRKKGEGNQQLFAGLKKGEVKSDNSERRYAAKGVPEKNRDDLLSRGKTGEGSPYSEQW